MYTYQLHNPTHGTLTLTRDPEGWAGLKRKLLRDPAYHGVQLDVTLDLTWTGPARAFINTVYFSEGIEGIILLTVYRRNPNTDRDEARYFGRLNLTRWSDKAPTTAVPLRAVVTNAEETGFQKAFLNAEDTAVNLLSAVSLNSQPLTPPAPAAAYLTSRVLEKQYDANPGTDPPIVVGAIPITSVDENRDQAIVIGMEWVRNDLECSALVTGFEGLGDVPWLYEAAENGPFDFDLNLALNYVGVVLESGDFDKVLVQLMYRFNDEPPTIIYDHTWDGVVGDFSEGVAASAAFQRDIEVGDRFYVYGRLLAFDVGLGSYIFSYRVQLRADAYIRIVAQTQIDATDCPGLLPFEAFERATALVTGQEAAFRSRFFGRIDSVPTAYPADGEGALNFLTTGFALRGFPLEQKPLTTSFKDVFDALSSLYPLGVGIETEDGRQVVVVEPLAYFYRAETALALRHVATVDYDVAADRYYNTVEVGNQKWRIDDIGGLDEVNGKREYATPIQQVKAKFSRLNKFSTAGALIEATRRKRYVESATKDDRADQDWFIIALVRTAGPGGYQVETDEPVAYAEGIPNITTAYNLRHTPGRILRRLGAPLRAAVALRPDPALRLTASEANAGAILQLNGEAAPIAENADLAAADLPPALWINRRAKVTTILRGDEVDRLSAFPYGVITFPDPDTGALVAGYLLEGEIDDADGRATLTLLLAA